MKKILLTVLSVLSGLIVIWMIFLVIGSLIIAGFFNPPIDKKKTEKIFMEDIHLLETVKDFLENSPYEDIYIHETMEKGEMSVDGKRIKIENIAVVEAVDRLKKRGYQGFTKNGCTIDFQRWSNLDCGRGIAYSIDGSEPTLQFLTKIEPLSEPNWYYYECDFNEWRLQNKE